MFNPADFDALTALVEKRYSQLPDNHHMKHERSGVLWCIHVARQTAKEYGMMAPEPAPVRLCQECGAAPELPYSALCKTCYTAFIDDIKQRQMQVTSTVLDAIADAKGEES